MIAQYSPSTEARIGFVVDDLEVNARLNLQAQLLDTHFNHARTTNQIGFARPKVIALGGVQHARLFPFRQHHALRVGARLREDRLHEQVGFIDKLGELIDVSVEVFNRRVATPESIAAFATAGAILTIRRGSNGFGMM